MSPAARVGVSTNGASGRRAAIAVFALAALIVVFVHRESPRTLVSAHGLLHTAIAGGIAHAPLALPPENPFFAGEPLPYYFVYHACAALLMRATGLHALHVFEGMTLVAIGALVLAAFSLARRLLGGGTRGAALAALVFAGASAQAPLFLIWRLARHGRAVFADDPAYLWGLVHPVSQHLRPYDPFGMYGPLIPFFLNVTARPIAIAALLVLLAALARAWQEPRARTLFGVTAAAALLASFGSLIALAVVAVLPPALALTTMRSGGLRRTIGIAVALGVGVAAAAPSFWQLFGVAGGETSILGEGAGTLARRVFCVTSAAAIPALLALDGLRRAAPAVRPLLLSFLLASFALAGAAVAVSLPHGNEDNLFHAALVLLAVPAAGAFARAWIAPLLFVPTLVLVLSTYLDRPPVALAFEHEQLVRLPRDGELARIYQVIRRQTEANAVIVIDPGPPIRAVAGNTAELPALTGRALYTERAKHYLSAPHTSMPDRIRIARTLTRGEPLAAADSAILARLGRPIYVLADPDTGSPVIGLDAMLGPPIARAGAIALYRVPIDSAGRTP